MKHIAIAGALALVSVPAVAIQTPAPAKGSDVRVCDVPYKANEVTNITAIAGNSVTITFGAKERMVNVALSNSVNLSRSGLDNSNVLYLKAKAEMPPQPISVRTLREDGTPRDYTIQWSAIMPSDKAPQACYSIRYQYAAEYSAEQIAKWRTQQAQAASDRAEIALHAAARAAADRNVRYVQMGDTQIGPTEIYDNGRTTWLHFPGGMPVPTIYSVRQDGAEAVVGDVHAEDNGTISISRTFSTLRLRSGDLVLCIFNRAWNAIGSDPGSGTTDPGTRRLVGNYQ